MYTVIAGTNRPKSNSAIVAEAYLQLLAQKVGGANVQYYSLQQLPENIAFGELYGNRSHIFQDVIDKYITPCEKFIFVIPEYNGGTPGILKLFIDAIPPENFKGKKAALVGVSSGRAGNTRGLDHFTGILNYVGTSVLARKPKLSGIEQLLKSGKLTNEKTTNQLKEQIELLVRF